MARVTRRPQAVADIFEIWDYIAEDSVSAADRWVDRLDETRSRHRTARRRHSQCRQSAAGVRL